VTQEGNVIMGGFILISPTELNSVKLRGLSAHSGKLKVRKSISGVKSLLKLKVVYTGNRDSPCISLWLALFLSDMQRVDRVNRGKEKRDNTNEKQKSVTSCPLLQSLL
jgi:hypothetical protein